MRRLATLVCAALLSACAQMPTSAPPLVTLGVQFNAAEARALLADGVNVIKGNAFMRQKGGVSLPALARSST